MRARRAPRAVGLRRLMRLGGRLDSGDELANARRNLFAEAGAVKDPVVADPLRQVIVLP